MITAENFWKKDLEEIEGEFLREGQKITDLPTTLNPVVPVQGSVLQDKVVNIDAVVKPGSLLRILLLKLLPAKYSW